MKTKTKRGPIQRKNLKQIQDYARKQKDNADLGEYAGYSSEIPALPSLLDVWQTDVERVILSVGRRDLIIKSEISPDSVRYDGKRMAVFSSDGAWWRFADDTRWYKSADTRVAYIFPPEFKEEKPKEEDKVHFGGELGLAEELAREEKHLRRVLYDEQKQSWLVRLDNWIKRLSRK